MKFKGKNDHDGDEHMPAPGKAAHKAPVVDGDSMGGMGASPPDGDEPEANADSVVQQRQQLAQMMMTAKGRR